MINLKKGRLLRSKRPLVFSGIAAFSIVLVLAVSVVIARVALSLSAPQQIATYDETRAQIESSYIEVLDRKGELLDKIRQDFAKRQGEWLPLDEISPSFITAILHSEDKRFYKHSGVDWLALLNATQIHLQQNL